MSRTLKLKRSREVRKSRHTQLLARKGCVSSRMCSTPPILIERGKASEASIVFSSKKVLGKVLWHNFMKAWSEPDQARTTMCCGGMERCGNGMEIHIISTVQLYTESGAQRP